ncbi:DUF4157 domain-containing protein [Flavobacterium sp.]|uniref:eCIS core domain-containing protein n=1 Tax=Flavobacterium sp. TaxID=239 RepID=UPI002B4B83F8|nr:DUF4157 domain-containing protein [Flavobacterium sp.]HLP65748.1 DUF4157 domain-containing protein [Flavobacterium sp.]
MSAFSKNPNPSHSSPSISSKNEDFFGVQAKLNIGKSNDKYEAEADSVADKIISNTPKNTPESFFSPSPLIQKRANEIQKQEETENVVQEKSLAENITPVVQLKTEKEETIQNKTEVITPEKNNSAEKTVAAKPLIQQKKTEEEVQTNEEEEIQGKEEEKELQMSAGADANPSDTSNLESNLNSSKGGGSSLSGSVKNEMESGFGADFSNVKIHNDSNAVQMNKELGSQAFASGNDIYFNEGKYNPNSKDGKHLLAHELTHTVQQGASTVQPKMIQKTETPTPTVAAPTPSSEYVNPDRKGSINTTSKIVTIPNLKVPSFKATFGPSSRFVIPKGGFPRNDNHIPAWETAAMSGSAFTSRFTDYAASQNAPNLRFNGEQIFYLSLKGGTGRRAATGPTAGDAGVIFGSIDAIKRRASRPYWTANGEFKPHDVDHKQEIQLGGGEVDTNNMWMLESSANRSSGSNINIKKNQTIEELLSLGRSSLIDPPESADAVKENYEIVVENGVIADRSIEVAGDPNVNWDLEQIKQGQHLAGLKFLTEAEVDAAGLRGSPDELIFYTNLTGGLPIKVPWDEQSRTAGRKDGLSIRLGKRGGAGLVVNTIIYNSTSGDGNFGGSGSIICTAFPGSTGMIREKTNLAFTIRPMAGVSYGGYIEPSSVLQACLHALEFKHMSPITLNQASLDDDIGLSATGTIAPTVPLIGNANIEVVIDETGARIRKLFQKSDFNFPAPFEITNTSLEVFAGTSGFGLTGEMNFKIQSVGDGFLRGSVTTESGFALAGGFNFDSQLFDPASIEVSYANEIFTIGGTVGIPEGKVRGVKRATITASYSENTFSASGDAELDIPGIQRGNMQATYSNEGFSIGGEFQLRNDIPGIRGGTVSATVSKQNGDEGYNVRVSGTAQPNIPGINSSLTVTYDNGALTLAGSADYTRGMLSGSVNVGATNRTIGEDGQPTGEPDDTMRVYGGGTLTLQLTPWLAATAGVKFLPNGEMEVTARLATDTYDVFPRKQFDRNLFTVPTIEIPLFAIPLGPRSLGLVAQASGGLDFTAGFGPGQLRNLSAEITYNPEHEEETTVAGHGEFVIPADAGLTLRGDLGLGLSIGIASLSGGIELAGTLGLEGEAGASVDVNWSPQTGLTLDAEGHITVNPKFTFDVNAFARASLGIGWFSISETWRHNLASFSWGPDIQFGLIFPIHYQEGEPFDISFDDLEVIYPELDVIDMAKNLASDIKDDIFD